jgi:lysophospholipid acyltransferase (LPLAT)-like uncharacterized protein
MTGRVRSGIVLKGTWDRFALAWPFSRVEVVLGAPIEPTLQDARVEIERSLARLNAEASPA